MSSIINFISKVLGSFMGAFLSILSLMLNLYMIILVGRAIISWVNPDPYNPIVRFLHAATEPVLVRVRRFLPLYGGGIDFTPMVLIFAIYFLLEFLKRLALSFG